MELKIVKFFNRLWKGTFVDEVTDFVSRILYLAAFWMVVTIGIFFFAPNGRVVAIAMTIAAALHFLISEGLIKHLFVKYFHKTRPYMAHPEEITPIGRKHSDSSFPSSHMAANLSVLTVILIFYPSLWPIVLIFTLLLAYARLHNGMHYLSDVAAGTILGIFYGIAGTYLTKCLLLFFQPAFDFLKNLL